MQSTEQKLKTCPFCGGPARLVLGEHDINGAEVFCEECGASCGHHSDDKHGHAACDSWNHRTPTGATHE